MRIRQIGTLVFNANTNIVVDETNQDAPGIGFRVNSLFDPQPFAVEIAFRRETRQQTLNAVNALARELYSYAQRRQNERIAVAGGAQVIVEDEIGGTSLRSYLRDAAVTLLSVEATSTGFLARVRVTGTLINPFVNYTATGTSVSNFRLYERRIVTLTGTSDGYLYKNYIDFTASNIPGLYNALLAIEELESATGTSRIEVFSPTTNNNNVVMQPFSAGWQTLTRGVLSSGGSATFTYNIPATLSRDVYRVFIEIFCQNTPVNARYIVSWPGQPQITETITGDRSWYTPALLAPDTSTLPLTLEIQNVPSGTMIMPLVLIPMDGVYVWNVVSSPTLSWYRIVDLQLAINTPFASNPPGIIYGAPGFVSSRYIAAFNGVMSPNTGSASSSLFIYSHRIEPASFA